MMRSMKLNDAESGDEEVSESESEGENDLNRRIAISKIGTGAGRGKGQTSKAEQPQQTKTDGKGEDLQEWIKGVVNELKELREMTKSQADATSRRKERRRLKKEKKQKKREKKIEKCKKKGNQGKVPPKRPNAIKSPSDTTLYAPGLAKLDKGGGPVKRIKARQQLNLIDQISNFVEKLRVEDSNKRSRSGEESQMREKTRADQAEKAILAAEVNKADVEIARGKSNSPSDAITAVMTPACGKVPKVDYSVSDKDGDFFNIDCHVDTALREKIERGEYVSLEKLLFKLRKQLRGPEDEEEKNRGDR